jgi:hypothetical protein
MIRGLQKVRRRQWMWAGIVLTVVLLAVVTALSPAERTLGTNARLVYFHGAWVWAGKLAFGAAAVCGLIGLLKRSRTWQLWSLALGWTGMFFWLTYLPLSLWIQQVNWGGIFWDEPRLRIPLMFGVIGLLLQTGMVLLEELRLVSLVNVIFGAALWYFLGNIQNVLHPDSPILTSNSLQIQLFFFALTGLSILFGGLLAGLLFPLGQKVAFKEIR